MAWFAKRRLSRRRANLERKALAASVEEITAHDKVSSEIWDEEEEEDATAERSILVPPALSLQSRPLPVVRVEGTKLAPSAEESRSHPETRQPVPAKRLGRSTKVHLQAVRPEQIREPVTERFPVLESAAPVAQEVPAQAESAANGQKAPQGGPGQARVEGVVHAVPASQPLAGSGTIELGQEEVTISVSGSQISAQSVVFVMLAGNPGPVVVQYVALHPPAGFTCHLSAPVAASTPFNYLVWPS